MNGQQAIQFIDTFLGRHAGLALALTWLVGILVVMIIHRRHRSQEIRFEQALGALRFELEEARIDRNPTPGWDNPSPKQNPETEPRLQFELELEAYRKLWPRMNELHHAIGDFLRAIEMRENAAERRLAARRAAASARETADAILPFCSESVERLSATLLDKYVHIHLTACAYLDGSTADQLRALNRHEPITIEVLREQARTVYEDQSKQELTALAREIRHRLGSLGGR